MDDPKPDLDTAPDGTPFDPALSFGTCPTCHTTGFLKVVDFAGRELIQCPACHVWRVLGGPTNPDDGEEVTA